MSNGPHQSSFLTAICLAADRPFATLTLAPAPSRPEPWACRCLNTAARPPARPPSKPQAEPKRVTKTRLRTRTNQRAAPTRWPYADVDTQLAYEPASGERWPFLRAQLDLCAVKCHRPNVSVLLELEATPTSGPHPNGPERRPPPSLAGAIGEPAAAFHCDRDSYSMLSKRRLCGKSQRANSIKDLSRSLLVR